jgi:hypothetical protein
VSTSNEFEAVDVIELSRNLVTEEPASTARRDSPSLNIFRVTPDQIAESTLMRDLLSTSNDADLINGTNLRAQTTMNTKNFTINDGSEDKEIENLAARLPNRRVTILLLTLLIKTIDLSDLARLVVASDEGDLVRVPWPC